MVQKKYKYSEISNKIKQDLINGKYKVGSMIPSDNELSKLYSVSNNTAREAVAVLVNENLVERVRGKGTFVKEVAKKRKTICLVIPKVSGDPKQSENDYDVSHKYIVSIENEARNEGIDLILSIYYNDINLEAECIKNAIARNVDGIISFFSCTKENHYLFDEIEKAGIPYVLLDTYHSEMRGVKIGTKCFEASAQVVDYFVSKGFKNIFYINSDYETWNPITPRLEGYKNGCKKNNIYHNVIYPIETVSYKGTNWQNIGYEIAKHIIESTKPPFAIFSVAPAFAVGAYQAIEEAEINKEDIAIACYDHPYSKIPKEVHSVYIIQHISQMSKLAIEHIIKEDKENKEILVSPDILITDNY